MIIFLIKNVTVILRFCHLNITQSIDKYYSPEIKQQHEFVWIYVWNVCVCGQKTDVTGKWEMG